MNLFSLERDVDAAQPLWAKRLIWFVFYPAFLVWGAAIVSSFDGDPIPVWGWVAFVLAFVVAMIRYYIWSSRD